MNNRRKRTFGLLPNGRKVEEVTLSAGLLSVSILTYGAILRDARFDGVPFGITLGHETLGPYLDHSIYTGAIVGPVANRIRNARVRIAGVDLSLEANEGPHTLHSGSSGLHAALWSIRELTPRTVVLKVELADGHGGLPGQRVIEAAYEVVAPSTLRLQLRAISDRPTPFNIANHSYWRLGPGDDWSGTSMQVSADHVLSTSSNKLPTGECRIVDGTPYDLRTAVHLRPGSPALDHTYCLRKGRPLDVPVARLVGPNGVSLALCTDAPGLHLFDGRYGALPGRAYPGLALEAQMWPDALNHSHFPNIVYSREQTFRQTTSWTFAR